MRTGGPAAGGEHKEADDDCCTPDRRTLRRGIRPDAGTAGLGGDSEQKGTLPKGLFVAKAPVSSKLKQRLVNDIASITMLALLRPANTAMGAGSGKMPEVLVIGLRVNTPGIPVEVIDLIAGQRKSGIVFVCVHEGESEGRGTRGVCAGRAPQRAGPGRVMCRSRKCSPANGDRPARSRWNYRKGTRRSAKTMDDLWDSLCAQAILDSADGANLDARIAAGTRSSR